MPLSDEQLNRVLTVLQERAPSVQPCPVCGQQAGYGLETGFVVLILQERAMPLKLQGPGVPLFVLTCNNCGNTQFLNGLRLGLGDIVVPAQPAEGNPDAAPAGQ